jgi:hypothetical protein
MKIAVRILPLVTGEGASEIRALIGIELCRKGVMCGRGFCQNEQTEGDYQTTVEHASHECLLRKAAGAPTTGLLDAYLTMPVSEFCIFRSFGPRLCFKPAPLQVFLQVLMAGGLKSLFPISVDSADVTALVFVSAESERQAFS